MSRQGANLNQKIIQFQLIRMVKYFHHIIFALNITVSIKPFHRISSVLAYTYSFNFGKCIMYSGLSPLTSQSVFIESTIEKLMLPSKVSTTNLCFLNLTPFCVPTTALLCSCQFLFLFGKEQTSHSCICP